MKEFVLNDFFDIDKCDQCGICLNKCPVLLYPIEKAKIEIKKLINLEKAEVILKCHSCFSCNLYCDKNCNPYNLILFNFYTRYVEKGISPIAKLVLPNEKYNLWTGLEFLFSKNENEIINNWDKEFTKQFLLMGCFTQFFPYLTESNIIKDIKKRGTEKLWCNGGHIYQLGLLDIVDQIGNMTINEFKRKKVEKIITFMEAEYSMIKNILPRFGHKIDIELETLSQYLLKEIKNNDLKLTKRLKSKVTIHDNCFSKSLGSESWDTNRQILNELGLKIIEMEHNKENATCCGFGAASYSFNVLDIMKQSYIRLKEAESTGAKALIVYCSACLFIFSVAKELLNIKLPIFHIFELVQFATGETPKHN
ncbi:MAG: heterodisulfide reductase-related iron-sulfur binding cluster, partial [Candidatus Helarchaeota archaeon]